MPLRARVRIGRTEPRRLVAAGLGGLLGIGLLVLAVPRTIATLATIPSSVVLARLQNQQPVGTGDLETVVRAQRRGLAFVDDGRMATDLGLAELLLAERLADDDPAVPGRLASAIATLRQGLAAAPGNPYAWARLAYAEARLHGWTPLALSSLRLALLTASYEPRLLWSRLRLSFLAWPYMPPSDQDLVGQQIRLAWQEDPAKLARLSVDLDRTAVVRGVLSRVPSDEAEFERLLKSLS
jgi:hypothetical protein